MNSSYWKTYPWERLRKRAGISRQGVHDLIKRCNQTLKDYEDKLQLVAKFVAIKDKVKQIDDLLDDIKKAISMRL